MTQGSTRRIIFVFRVLFDGSRSSHCWPCLPLRFERGWYWRDWRIVVFTFAAYLFSWTLERFPERGWVIVAGCSPGGDCAMGVLGGVPSAALKCERMQPLIITCAPVGAEVTLDQTPHLLYTARPNSARPHARFAKRAHPPFSPLPHRRRHEHPRDRTLQASLRRDTGASDLHRAVFTGGAIGIHTRRACEHLLQLRPEMATLTCGTVNFGDDVFENSFPIMRGILGEDAATRRAAGAGDLR